MIYELSKCKVCGSEELIKVDKEIVGLDTYVIYKCNSCDSLVSKEKPKKKVEKECESDYCGNSNRLPDRTPAQIYDKYHKAVYSINCLLEDDDECCGTAFAIGTNGYLLTNAHVVTKVTSEEDGQVNFEIHDNITATSYNGDVLECELIDIDIMLDIAILKVNKRIDDSVKLDHYESIRTGEKVVTIGNSKGEGIAVTEGLISDKDRTVCKKSKILISVPINKGNSGGPLFNIKGLVVAVVASGKKDAVAMNYAIPIKDVIKFVKKVESEEKVRILN